ncbi:MAG: 2-hydroxyacid dehydrogenase [Planctomycetota bacterium]|nr:2-hydroxyacid dehydrogenase [Planctomycetota bacterium]MDA1177168.1 2-hydroxyacid dehydrogenase [Planctomycetota bacterium]
MRIAVFGTKPYDRTFFEEANGAYHHELVFLEPRLSPETAILAKDSPAVCLFVNDDGSEATLKVLAENGVRLLALRCAGFNNVDMQAAQRLHLRVVRVPAYSPYAVAEHTVALMLALNRQIHRAHQRVRDGNFSLQGLLGFDMHGRTVGIIGTGAIGATVATILHGFGCQILACDKRENGRIVELGGHYVDFARIWRDSDIITLHCPLTPETKYLVNADTIEHMRRGVMLINTSRGAVVDTRAVLAGLKSGKIGSLGLDVYEEEADLFFEDLSEHGIDDDLLARLTTFPNVLITGHQAFFTREALQQIAATTLANVASLQSTGTCGNEIHLEPFPRP